MKTGGNRKFMVAAIIIVIAVLAAFYLSTGARGKDGGKAASPIKAEPAAPPVSGYTVAVTGEAQRTAGITTEALKPGLYQKSVVAYGKVLPPAGLNASRKSYMAAMAGLQKAEAALNASEKEYARMKVLNDSAKNVSDRALQAAAAQRAADKAEEANARGALQSAKDAIRLEWGPVVSGWIFDYSAPLRRLLETKDVLVQVTMPAAVPIQGIPKEVRIEPSAVGPVPARFVSRATSTDPKIQGISFIYTASGLSGSLVPGMDVTVQVSSGRSEAGFFVPHSAVVWLQDKAWVYVKKSETGFTRVEVSTSNPVNDGYIVSGVFSPGAQLVIKGAQSLLSEESTPRAVGAGGEGEDED
jgi:hypothetical protein